jgi:MSHA biogenesis protein MshQ
MKLTGTPFNLWVAALTTSGIATGYSATQNKYVLVNLVPNITTNNACSPNVCSSACTIQNAVESTEVGNGGSQVASFPTGTGTGTQGVVLTPSFTLNLAHQNLIAVMKECTTSACTSFTSTAPACSSDEFSVRPLTVSMAATGNATMHAGTDQFTVTGTVAGTAGAVSNYTGTLTANTGAIAVVSPATNLGTVSVATPFAAATSGTPSTVSATFNYSDVGSILLDGWSTTTPAFVDDETWTSVDSVNTKNDCNISTKDYTISYSNKMDPYGKYGCYFGNSASSTIGRFIPDHFILSGATVVNRSDLTNTFSVNGGIGPYPASSFTYLSEPLQVQFTLKAVNLAGNTTLNYAGALSQFSNPVSGVGTGTNSLGLWGFGSGYTVGTGTCNAMLAHAATAGSYPTSFANCIGGAVAPTPIACLTAGPNCSATGARITAGTPSFTSFTNGVSTVTTKLTIGRADLPDGPYSTFEIGAVPTDGDGVTLATSALNVDTDTSGVGTAQRQLLGSQTLYYGRLTLGNAYGSELLPLWVPVKAQYVKSFVSASPKLSGPIFATNTVDSATSFSTKSNLSIGAYTGTLGTSNLTISNIAVSLYDVNYGTTLSALNNGLANIEITPPSGGPPTPTGSAFLALTLGNTNTNENCVLPALANATSGASLSYLQWGWCTGKLDPNALITFGTPVNRFIYLRENY